MPMVDDLARLLLNQLLWTSLQAVVLVGIVALIVRWVPRLPAAARSALWWLIGLQVVIGLCWQAPVRLPLLAPPAQTFREHMQGPAGLQGYLVKPSGAAPQPATVVGWKGFLTWRNGLATLWLLGLLAQMPIIVRDRQRTRGWLRETVAPDDYLRRRSEELSRKLGLRGCPRLRVSSSITSPLVAGLVRPVILWPARSAFTHEETSLALAHELAHLKRDDLWLACIPAIAQCLFFFHPFVRSSVREYAMHREAACDTLAMRACGADAEGYGRLLLQLGVSGLRPTTLAGASATFRGLKRRLLMLPSAGGPVPRARCWLLVALIAAVGVLPYRVVVASRPAVIHVKAGTSYDGKAATRPADCNGVGADEIRFCGANYLVYTGAARKGRGAVLFDKGKVIIAGVHADVVAANQFYQTGARLLWFRRDGKAYVVRDPLVLQRADGWVAFVAARMQKEDALNSGLDKLNRRVAALNRRLGKLNQQLGSLNDRQHTLTDQYGERVDPKAEADIQARVAGIETRIRTQKAQIDDLQRSMDVQQTELQGLQRTSSAKFRSISAGLEKLVDEALASHLTRRVDR